MKQNEYYLQHSMQMEDFKIITHEHKYDCAFVESLKHLCGSIEINQRRLLSCKHPKHIHAPEQPATPILPCDCGVWTKAWEALRFKKPRLFWQRIFRP